MVLSALSGTTNALVEISESLSHGDRNTARQQIDALHEHYKKFTSELLKNEASITSKRGIE